jgi:hypothetical protein
MEGKQEREAPMAWHFREANIAPMLEISTTLKRVKMSFTAGNFFFNLTLLRCTQLVDALMFHYLSSASEYIYIF